MANALCRYSRHCSAYSRTPSARESPKEFLKALSDVVKAHDVRLLIPMDDPECDLFSRGENVAMLGCQVAIPSEEIYQRARDKSQTVRLAEEIGIRTPRTSMIESEGDINRAADLLGFPFIVKPTTGSGSRGFAVIRDAKMVGDVRPILATHGPLLAQEFIPPGGSVGVSYLARKGEELAFFTHKRILEFPESGGPSIVRESVHHQASEDAGRLLIRALGWTGVAMAEFRLDSRTGAPVLMEVNPRFWGSLPLAIASGVDFPRLLCDMYENLDARGPKDYRVGVKCVNFLPLGLASIVARGGMRRAMTIAKYALESGNLDVESLVDPLPSLGALVAFFEYASDREKMESFYR